MTVSMETVRMAKSRPRKDQSERSDLPCHIIKRGILSELCHFLHGCHNPDFHRNPSKLCITENLIAGKLQKCIFQCCANY